MTITSIRTNLFSNNKYRNIQTQNPSFKGYEYHPRKNEYLAVLPNIEKVTKEDLPSHWGYSHDKWKVYILSPHENLTDEIRQKYAFVQWNNLPLSQIKNDCHYVFRNFAENARCEAKHYEFVANDSESKIEYLKKRIELLEKHMDKLETSGLKNRKNLFSQAASQKDEKLENLKTQIAQQEDVKLNAQKRVELANKREKVLEKLDNLDKKLEDTSWEMYSAQRTFEDGEKSLNELLASLKKDEQDHKKKLIKIEKTFKLNKNTDNSILKEKIQTEIERFEEYKQRIVNLIEKTKQKISDSREKYKQKTEEMDMLKEQINQEFENVAEFYREYYPEWADI